MLHYMCSVLVSTAFCLVSLLARLDFRRFHRNQFVSDLDPMDSIVRLSNPPHSVDYTFGFNLALDFRSRKWLVCSSGFITRLDSIGLQVLSIGI